MKGKNIGRIALAMGMSVATVLGTTSCSRDYTVAYVYTTSAQNASVSAFAVDYQAGVLTQTWAWATVPIVCWVLWTVIGLV